MEKKFKKHGKKEQAQVENAPVAETENVEQPVAEATEEAPKPKRERKHKEPKEPKAPRVSMGERRESFKSSVVLHGDVEFETPETAKRGENSATVACANAIMFVKPNVFIKSTAKNKSRRVLEVWLHLNKIDVAVTKKVYDRIQDVDFKAAYDQFINREKKNAKYILSFTDEVAAVNFVNQFIRIVGEEVFESEKVEDAEAADAEVTTDEVMNDDQAGEAVSTGETDNSVLD